jgi:hypothetical protein
VVIGAFVMGVMMDVMNDGMSSRSSGSICGG